jgi:hypothetical protein
MLALAPLLIHACNLAATFSTLPSFSSRPRLARTPPSPAATFADVQLLRKGRCHESEVYAAFRRQHARYRQPEALPDSTLRDMVRNWHPDVERTRTGYLKNLSLRPRLDPFTGQATGNQDMAVLLDGADSSSGAAAEWGLE